MNIRNTIFKALLDRKALAEENLESAKEFDLERYWETQLEEAIEAIKVIESEDYMILLSEDAENG